MLLELTFLANETLNNSTTFPTERDAERNSARERVLCSFPLWRHRSSADYRVLACAAVSHLLKQQNAKVCKELAFRLARGIAKSLEIITDERCQSLLPDAVWLAGKIAALRGELRQPGQFDAIQATIHCHAIDIRRNAVDFSLVRGRSGASGNAIGGSVPKGEPYVI